MDQRVTMSHAALRALVVMLEESNTFHANQVKKELHLKKLILTKCIRLVGRGLDVRN